MCKRAHHTCTHITECTHVALSHSAPRRRACDPLQIQALVGGILVVDPAQRPTITQLLEAPEVAPYAQRYEMANDAASGSGEVRQVDIPLVGYEGTSKKKFSERPIFVEGGGRIVDEAAISAHDEKCDSHSSPLSVHTAAC